jgi:hypothetical protein
VKISAWVDTGRKRIIKERKKPEIKIRNKKRK